MSFFRSASRRHARTVGQPLEQLETRVLLAAAAVTTHMLKNYDWVSDMTPNYVSSGFGPIGVDQSNGDAAQDDGSKISINGHRYGRGIGVHADSEVRYTLNGKYRDFVADVGVDDEVGGGGSVVFQVFADGTKLYDSGLMTGEAAAKRVNVDVAGRQELTLIVNDAGDGNTDDHADWAWAHLDKQMAQMPKLAMPADTTLNEGTGSTFNATGSFDDSAGAGGPYTATVDWGDGHGAQSLPLNADGTFSLNHTYDPAKPGDYTVLVHVANAKATGFASTIVTMTNTGPSHVQLLGADDTGRMFTTAGFRFGAMGAFQDPGQITGEGYTYRIDFGDGSPVDSGPVSHFVFVDHTYVLPGSYSLKLDVIDEAGNVGSGTNTIVVRAPVAHYISDIPANDIEGIGPANDANARNGKALKLNGVRYNKGLGVTADSSNPSTITYDITGAGYRAFQADVGYDDFGGAGSVTFQVFADGNEVFNSGVMDTNSATQHVNLDVTGIQFLKLVVTDASGGTFRGFADWAGARLI